MFSRGPDVVLEYRVVLEITNNSLSKRTMRVVNPKFLAISESAKWAMVFKLHTKKILTSPGQQ